MGFWHNMLPSPYCITWPQWVNKGVITLFSQAAHCLTILVRRLEYSTIFWSILWLMMPWLLHHQIISSCDITYVKLECAGLPCKWISTICDITMGINDIKCKHIFMLPKTYPNAAWWSTHFLLTLLLCFDGKQWQIYISEKNQNIWQELRWCSFKGIQVQNVIHS